MSFSYCSVTLGRRLKVQMEGSLKLEANRKTDRESFSCKSPSLHLKAFGCPRSPSTGDLTESQECIRGESGINSVEIALRYSGGSYYINGANCPH